MSKGRGSALAATLVLYLMLLQLHYETVEAATLTVGGGSGWTFNTDTWPKGKRFWAGDMLVFKYNSAIHNVVAVDRGGYNGCSTPKGARVLTSGKDQIRLAKGPNYFICNIPGHCQAGMKIFVNAL